MTNPTINFQAGDVKKLPVVINEDKIDEVNKIVDANCKISKEDWDSVETSWGFKKHPLV